MHKSSLVDVRSMFLVRRFSRCVASVCEWKMKIWIYRIITRLCVRFQFNVPDGKDAIVPRPRDFPSFDLNANGDYAASFLRSAIPSIDQNLFQVLLIRAIKAEVASPSFCSSEWSLLYARAAEAEPTESSRLFTDKCEPRNDWLLPNIDKSDIIEYLKNIFAEVQANQSNISPI